VSSGSLLSSKHAHPAFHSVLSPQPFPPHTGPDESVKPENDDRPQQQVEAIRDRQQSESLRDELCVHIFTVSAGLVGVCLTVIGLFRVISRLKDLNSIADNILAIDALAFLGSCLTAFLALRTVGRQRRQRLERLADGVFLTGLVLMVVVCGLVAYELI